MSQEKGACGINSLRDLNKFVDNAKTNKRRLRSEKYVAILQKELNRVYE